MSGRIRLWQFAVATFLATQILHGVSGWFAWGVSLAIAWAVTRTQVDGEKRFFWPLVVWAGLMLVMSVGHSQHIG